MCEIDYNWGTNISRCIAHQCLVVSVLGCFCNGYQEYDRWNMMLIIQLPCLDSDRLNVSLEPIDLTGFYGVAP